MASQSGTKKQVHHIEITAPMWPFEVWAEHGVIAPRTYKATIDDANFAYLVDMDVVIEDGVPVCEALIVYRRPGGTAVGVRGLRGLCVQEILDQSFRQVSAIATATPVKDGVAYDFGFPGEPGPGKDDLVAEIADQERKRRRQARIQTEAETMIEKQDRALRLVEEYTAQGRRSASRIAAKDMMLAPQTVKNLASAARRRRDAATEPRRAGD